MAIAIAQITIIDFNDINIANSAPSNPVKDQLWLDSSTTPNALKRWDVTTGTWVASTALSLAELDSIANDKLTNVKENLDDLADDNKLTPAEKLIIKKEWDAIVAEEPILWDQGTAYGIVSEKNLYYFNYAILRDYTLAPVLADLTTTSDIVGNDFRVDFANYYTAKVNLLNAIANKLVRANANYNSTYITQDGMLVKNASNNIVLETGEFDKTNHLYGTKVSHTDGSYTQLYQNGLERLVAGESKPYHYETYIVSGSTIGMGDGYIVTGETTEEEKKAVWYGGIWLELPARFKNKNFSQFLALSQLNVPLADTGTDSVMNLFIESIDHVNYSGVGVNVVAYTEAFWPGEGTLFRGLEFLLIATM